MSANDHQSDELYCVLSGWLENEKSENSMCIHTLKEVIVWQHAPVITVFNVVEYGQRHMRVQEYTSSLSVCGTI